MHGALTRYQLPLLTVVMAVALVLPGFVFAQPLVPCGGVGQEACGFNDLLKLVANIIDFVILIAMPVAAVLFAYAGFLYLTDGGSGKNISKARGIFTNVAIGFVIVLGAWLLVKLIVTTFVADTDTRTFLQIFLDF